MYFLTRSKKASSSEVALEVDVGGRGSGTTGVRVGETIGASEAMILFGCDDLARFKTSALVLFFRMTSKRGDNEVKKSVGNKVSG